jgi:hypothetical protein
MIFGKEITIDDYERDNEFSTSESVQDENSVADVEYGEKPLELNQNVFKTI